MPLRQKRCPFANLPDTKPSHWGEGITEAFTEWTRDGHLRHASFLGVRDDIAPRDVRREG